MTTLREDAGDLARSLTPSAEEKAGVSALFTAITADVKALMREEAQMAKAELQAEASKVGKGAGMLGAAGFAALMTVIFLSTALWWGLANLMDQGWAALIVAALWALAAAVLFVVGRGVLKSIHLSPDRTLHSLKQIPAVFTGARGDLS